MFSRRQGVNVQSSLTFRTVSSIELREETAARHAAAKTRLLPNRLHPHGRAIERDINLVTRRDSQTVAHRFRNHHLPLGANTVSHIDEYNHSRWSTRLRERMWAKTVAAF